MTIIHWAGDSTNTCNKANKYPQTGIAQAFDRFTASDVVIYDHAINGRSTKSFIDQGRLDRIDSEMGSITGAKQYLFIQFGHNDEKVIDPERYTDPDTTFIENLGRFAEVARRHGAVPLFITPIERRNFEPDHVTMKESTHKAYVEAYHKAAERYEVPLIDLCKASRRFLESVGDEPSKRYFMHVAPGEVFWLPDGLSTDNTHLKYEGAMKFGELLAREMLKCDESFSSLVDAGVIRELDAAYESNVFDDGVSDEYGKM